jgi:hypothetical protein
LAEVIALARATRLVRDENGAIVGVERIGDPAITPGDVLKAEAFLGHYQPRPMA